MEKTVTVSGKVFWDVLDKVMQTPQAKAPKPKQTSKAPAPKIQPYKRGSMTLAEAGDIVNGAIRRMAQEHNLSFPQAVERLKQEKPLILAGYQAVKNRERAKNARKEH